MAIDLKTGLLSDAEFLPSPNYNSRPDKDCISLLVIHNISLPPGKFGGDDVERLFLNQLDCKSDSYKSLEGLKVSAHLYIKRDGKIIQFVPFHLRAWHAGVSSFDDIPNCNDYSIGIELEGTDDIPYTVEQYNKLAFTTAEIMRIYPSIGKERIVGHNTIAPNRKTDPGPSFDWSLFYSLLEKEVPNETDYTSRLRPSADI